MSLDDQRNRLIEEYELDEKDYETYFKPKFVINDRIKQEVIQKYNVIIKKFYKIRVSGGKDKDTRLHAIIELLQLNKREEEEEFYDEDSDNIELIRNFGQVPSDEKQTAAMNQPQQPKFPSCSSITTDDKRTDESISSYHQNPMQNRYRNIQNRASYQQGRNNTQNRNYQHNQSRIMISTSNENNSGYRPNRNLNQDAPQSYHIRNNPNNNFIHQNNDNQDGHEEINDNNIDDKNEGNNNTYQSRRGGRGGGRGNLGRGRGRGGRRAPLGPRASILGGDIQNEDNQQRHHQDRIYNRRYRGGNHERVNMHQDQQSLQLETDNSQNNQQPIDT